MRATCHCGQAGWTFNGDFERITACNCTLCRRYGALWAYGYEDVAANLFGETSTYTRADVANPALEIQFCAKCAGVTGYRSLELEEGGLRKIAVNVRLAPPEAVSKVSLDRFDGLKTFEDLPDNGQHVGDVWF